MSTRSPSGSRTTSYVDSRSLEGGTRDSSTTSIDTSQPPDSERATPETDSVRLAVISSTRARADRIASPAVIRPFDCCSTISTLERVSGRERRQRSRLDQPIEDLLLDRGQLRVAQLAAGVGGLCRMQGRPEPDRIRELLFGNLLQ